MSIQDEKQYWDEAAKDPDLDNKYIADPAVASVEACLNALALNHPLKGNILDIGCGVGRLAIPIASENPEAYVYGTDISERMLSIADKRFNEDLLTGKIFDNFETRACNGHTLPFLDNFFSNVYSVLTFQHIPNHAKESYIIETTRILIPGGIFRFQFIEDAEIGPVSYGINQEDILAMCANAGLGVANIDYGWVQPNWTWIRAIKPNA